MLYASLNTAENLKTATDSNDPKAGNSFTKIKHPWHHQLDTKHHFLHVKFEVRFAISFTRKSMSNKK
jgi:hypothetical protein